MQKGVYSRMTNLDILGNDQADKLANKAAKSVCVSLDASAPTLYYVPGEAYSKAIGNHPYKST